MPKSKKPVQTPKQSARKPMIKTKRRQPTARVVVFIKSPYYKLKRRIDGLLIRRPHRSFRPTRRRDYVRTLKLPGYWAFTNNVRKLLWSNKKLFLLLALTYALLSVLLVGLGSQDTYQQLADTLRTTGSHIFSGNFGEIGKASLLVTTAASGSLNGTLTDVQAIYATITALITWLTTVWLLRAIMAKRKPRLRDGLYNASSPILSTFLVSLLLIVQLLPIALAVIGFSAALPAGILDGGVESMVFWAVALLLTMLSLYWITSTIIALVVVTLPGMYPMQAIKTAGDLVIGRRVRVLLRFLWLLLTVIGLWAITMIPIILFDAWIKGIVPAIQWVPLVPMALVIVSSMTIVWSASYVYVFYRKVVDDDSAPA